MAQERLSMRKIREIMRLYYEKQLSQRTIAQVCRVSHSTVKEYVSRASAVGLSWPLPEELSEEQLYGRLYPEKEKPVAAGKTLPDWQQVKQELSRKHVTLRLLWTEYREREPNGYGYSQFCELYRQWKKSLDVPMRQDYKAGEKVFVDYTGDRLSITNPETGETQSVEVFVGVLGYSSYTYAEAQPSQSRENWIGGHVRMLQFFGGVPEVVVPDNLKSGVKDPCYYDPELNPAYQELAEHYALVVLPARVRKPRDKAKVETGVQVVERWIMARLRHDTFFSLADLNRRIQELLRELNDRSMAHLGQSRRELFEAIDLPALNPLPQKPYEFAQTKIARVSIDYHVEYDKHFYSVPNRLIHEEVRLRVTEHLVEIYHKSQRDPAAVHPRSYATGRHTTCKEHMPLNHQRRQEWSPERFLKWAEQVGPNAKNLIQTALARRKHPEQAYRTCLGILNLSKKHSPERLDEACRQALAAKVFAYGDVKDILDQLPSADPALSSTPTHPNLRGGGYYQ